MPYVKGVVKELHENIGIDKTHLEKLKNALYRALVKNVPSKNVSGIVVVGFGNKQFYPSCVNVELDGFSGGKLRQVASDKASYGGNGACIIPFAQTDVVKLFLRGIDDNLMQFIRRSTAVTMRRVLESLFDELDRQGCNIHQQFKEDTYENLAQSVSGLEDRWTRRTRMLWGPVIGSIGALPKEDLGEVAEALVDLTRFRRHASTSPESVGGPIDVAIISRGDGFVWTKRKHYFPAELNPRAIARYQKID